MCRRRRTRRRRARLGRGFPEAAVECLRTVVIEASFAGAAPGGRGLTGRLLTGAECGADVRVGQVVAVAEHDGGALLLRELVREMLDLRVRGPIVGRLAVELGSRLGAAFPALVGGDPSCDREHPGAQVAAVPQTVVAAERPEKGLLKCILGPLPPEQAHEVHEDGVAVLRVEALERRDGHRFHHPLQRGGRGGCEMRGRRPSSGWTSSRSSGCPRPARS